VKKHNENDGAGLISGCVKNEGLALILYGFETLYTGGRMEILPVLGIDSLSMRGAPYVGKSCPYYRERRV
jgi:hypothetical protein